VLGARDDLVMPYWFAQDAAAAISNSRLVIYEHGGHMFPETRTSDFLQDVNSFLT
jgi:pimeloyl-ACP methyl ester carboxylesterase